MHNSLRLLVVLFLTVLVLHNYNSNKVLNLALDALSRDFEERTRMAGNEIAEKLKGMPLDAKTLAEISDTYKLEAIALYGKDQKVQNKFWNHLSPALKDELGTALNFPEPSTHREPYLVRRLTLGNVSSTAAILIFDAEELFRIERSTKIVRLLNLVIIGFAAILGFYFIESTLRPLRVLMQTARTASPGLPETGNRNDSDFLIGTFKGVIGKLKEKEQELGRLHQAEKARADDVEQLNQDLLRSISSGLILIDKEGKIRVFNQAAASILQVSRLVVLHQSYQNVLPRYSSLLLTDVERCFTGKDNIQRAEMEVATERGIPKTVTASVMPLQDRQQQFAGVFCIFSDITDFKLLQQHMAQKEKFASLGEMAAGVAHEFRNSVATITGYLQMAENRMTAEQQSYIFPIQKELSSLQKVVNDFLSFARPVHPQLESVNLGDMIRDCIEETGVSSKNVSFSVDGEFPQIPGDESMLRQIFTNVLKNAVEAINGINRAGKVDVNGAISNDAKMAQIEIRDNGAGIRAVDLERIFTPFYSTKENGVGLGLSIVQKLVLSHNGTIDVNSGPESTVFKIQLPLAAEHTAS